MSDTTLIDMNPFLERHERKARRAFIAITSVSLALSAVILAYTLFGAGAADAAIGGLRMPVVMGPLAIIGLWIASALYGRKRPLLFDGRLPMNPDDARSAARVANAGLVFVIGFGTVMIAGQLVWLRSATGVVQNGVWSFRATLVAIGLLAIYFGNVSPRMPTPRAPEAKPAVRMKYNRLAGWMTVLLGLSFAIAGLFLPLSVVPLAVGGVSIAVVLAFAVGAVMYRKELKSRIA